MPLWASFLTGSTRLWRRRSCCRRELYGWNSLGESEDVRARHGRPSRTGPGCPRRSRRCRVHDAERAGGRRARRRARPIAAGAVLHRNFTTFVVEGDAAGRGHARRTGGQARVARIDPARFSDARGRRSSGTCSTALKVNGAGAGHFEYRSPGRRTSSLRRQLPRRSSSRPRPSSSTARTATDAREMAGDYMRGWARSTRAGTPTPIR